MRFINFLKMSSLALMLCLATQLQAADVDVTTAQNAARSFLTGQVVSGRMKAQAMTNLTLVKAEASVAKPTAVDYYIFNAEKSYVVIAGDDQAPEVLMYGDEGALDIDNIPPAMQWLLNKYKYQIDGIKAGTLAPVNVPRYATAIPPLVTANWDQSAPYNNQCPTSGNRHAVTGCPATSLAMCYYKWKWPKTFPACAYIPASSDYYGSYLAAPALSERAADWDNIIDEYTGPSNYSSTSAQKDAVAWLMRYAGQAIPNYQYSTDASGATDPDILQGVINMGYTNAQLLTLTTGRPGYNQAYTDTQWNNYMMAELQAGRPIEYLASDPSSGGHAFNVFGCDASGKYYVNWGWSGSGNAYCTLHNFTANVGSTGSSGSYVFNYGEAMIIGIEPPAGALGPGITVNPTSLTFSGYVGQTYTQTINVKGTNLTGNITVAKSGNGIYSVSPTTIIASQAMSSNGVNVTVTYAPTAAGNTNATLTLSSSGADNVTVAVNGTAQAATPTLIVNNTNLTFNGKPGKAETKTISLTGRFVTGNVTVTLDDPNNVFTLSSNAANAPMRSNGMAKSLAIVKAEELAANQSTSRDQKVKRASTREKAGTQVSNSRMANMNGVPARVPRTASGSITIPGSSISETTPVNIGVTFNAAEEGNYTGSITIAANGAETVTVPLRAEASDGGTASDAYLDIAKYATIGQPGTQNSGGWNANYVNNLYKYTEDQANDVAWLTLPVYGAWASVYYAPKAQKWITTNYNQSPGTSAMGNEDWDSSSPLLGSSVYFTSTTAKYFGNTSTTASGNRTISFNLKNVTEVRLLGKNAGGFSNIGNNRRCTVNVYKCTLNADGTVTPGSTAVKTATGDNNASGTVNLSITDLDVNEIYQVVVSTIRTHVYEIAFQTPLTGPRLVADPADVYISAEPGSSATATFNVKGKNLENPVSVTLSDANGVFSISPTSISIADAQATNGADVTVTLNAADAGTYTGTVTLTSGTVSQTVNLYGTVAEKGDAHGGYLDIAKYATLDENDWYGEYADKVYSYTEYASEGKAWLTMPAFMAYAGLAYDNQDWGGLNSAMSIWNGITWNSNDVFKGSSYYYGSHTAYFMGSEDANTTGTNTLGLQVFDVTNCTQAKAYCYNYTGTTSQYPAILMVVELVEGDGGILEESDDVFDQQTSSTTGWVTLTSVELDPTKIYRVYAAGYHTFITEMAFCTPMGGLPGVPEIVSVDPTATTADITWTPGENNEDWNLRYRPYVEVTTETSTWNFDNSSLGNWTTIDSDGDGYNWVLGSACGGVYLEEGASLEGEGHNSSQDLVTSGSYSNIVGALAPDNYLVSPKVKLGGTISFWAKGQDSNYSAEVFGVAVSTNSNTNVADFTMVGSNKTATSNWVQYTFDLSDYAGQEGYIAIRHYNVSDMFMLDIDDIEITFSDAVQSPWVYVYSEESPYTIIGLTPETTYEVQVQGVNDIGASDWTASTIFTTLAEAPITLAELVATGVQNQSYSIVDGDLTCVKVLDVEGGAMLLCKDDNKLAEASRDVNNGAIDYMANIGNEIVNTEVGITDVNVKGANYDQSNWVALYLPSSVGSFSISGGSLLTKVKGVYTDNVNHTIELTAVPVVSEANAYAYNVFIPAAFRGTQTSSVHNNDYFFVQPEPMEVAWITWAVWDGSKFVMPAMEYGNNQANLQGQFFVNCSLLETNGYDLSSLSQNEAYSFIALMKKEAATGSVGKSTTPRRADGDDGGLVAYAISVPQSLGDVVTGVNDLVVGRNVKSVTYYNVHGQASMTPFSGLNMVEVRYTDGTRRVVKIMK